ncbi:MAG: CDP-diacylglycerol--serine O-phosphatidyltransferase [Gammaproteobacteria bacterium]|nr:CDP-diacylglycerol--serine O-phosphatidyltransferase [Gammaproteobacteria bacterium]
MQDKAKKKVLLIMNQDQRRRGIYILPNLFTTAALFAGFYAMVQAMNGNFGAAPLAIYIAMVMDGLDGRVARWTNTQSDFGAEYDSLADMVSFGMAPALIMYEWALSGLGKIGWLVAFIYACSAALRLARFNTQLDTADKQNFYGLPSPSAAAVVMGFIWVLHSYGVPGREISFLALAVTLGAGLLMVSNIRYRSFKDLNVKGKVSFMAVLLVPAAFVLVFLDPPRALFGVFMLYALSGPVRALYQLVRHGRKPGNKPATTTDSD